MSSVPWALHHWASQCPHRSQYVISAVCTTPLSITMSTQKPVCHQCRVYYTTEPHNVHTEASMSSVPWFTMSTQKPICHQCRGHYTTWTTLAVQCIHGTTRLVSSDSCLLLHSFISHVTLCPQPPMSLFLWSTNFGRVITDTLQDRKSLSSGAICVKQTIVCRFTIIRLKVSLKLESLFFPQMHWIYVDGCWNH